MIPDSKTDLSSTERKMEFKAGFEPVPGYRLIEQLGRGGFGEVWKAPGPLAKSRGRKAITALARQF